MVENQAFDNHSWASRLRESSCVSGSHPKEALLEIGMNFLCDRLVVQSVALFLLALSALVNEMM